MCPLCVEDHSYSKQEKGEYVSFKHIREDALKEIRTLRERVNEAAREMENVSRVNGNTTG